jgi:hypothetical protein
MFLGDDFCGVVRMPLFRRFFPSVYTEVTYLDGLITDVEMINFYENPLLTHLRFSVKIRDRAGTQIYEFSYFHFWKEMSFTIQSKHTTFRHWILMIQTQLVNSIPQKLQVIQAMVLRILLSIYTWICEAVIGLKNEFIELLVE